MRYKILNYAEKHNKFSLEDLAKGCNVDIRNKSFLSEFNNLYNNKFIDCTYGFFHINRWFITKKGKNSVLRRNKKIKKRLDKQK